SWDSDLDGSPGCEDCDDADPTTFPGATETCDGRDEDCDGAVDEGITGTTWYHDADGDGWGDAGVTAEACARPVGYSADPTDCDDADAAVHPSAPEACNAADDDCDGAVDEPDRFGNDRWYTDADGDGAGDPLDWVASCEPVAGRVATGEDCDDADADVHPDAVEHCDSVDEDCDGTVDDGGVDPLPWYRDADRDNWGTETDIAYGCTRPTGYVATPGDCDDTTRAISPDDREVCGGGDEDCDGAVDETGATGGTRWYPDLDGDGYGDEAAAVEACTAPAGMTEAGGDCDDSDPVVFPDALEIDCGDATDYNCDGSVGRVDNDGDGFDACEECDDGDAARSPDAAEVCDGVDEDCDGEVDDDATDASSWYPDVDGDGFGDDLGNTRACEAPDGFVADGGDCDDADGAVSPGATESCATDADDDCDGDDNVGGTGCTEWHADADGDGYGDAAALCLCVAEWPYVADDAEDCDDGASAVNPDGVEACGNGDDDDCDGYAAGCGVAGLMSLADADGKLTGAAASDTFGNALAAPGDLDGDGVPELFVGAPAADGAATDGGVVYHFVGPFDGGTVDATTA
ncbi:MAG: MopE-related protein, partial [Myxococcota bacterium]